MKWLLVLVGIVVAIVAGAALIGATVPRHHRVTREASYQQPPQVVWEAITDHKKFPEWRKTIAKVEPLPSVNGKPVWREVNYHGEGVPYEVVDAIPPSRLITRIADPKLPYGGTWTFEISPNPVGATLRITEDGEVRNVIYRFMIRYMFGYKITLDAYLKALGQKFGENVSIED
jgi:uncharacterized protein YndB with AHSA1/START domain